MKQQNEKGITLIALAITTIVILILASVSLSAIKDKGSAIRNAKEESYAAERESIIQKLEAELYNEKVKTGDMPTKTILKEIIQGNEYNEGELGEDSFTTKVGGYEIQYSEIVGWEGE